MNALLIIVWKAERLVSVLLQGLGVSLSLCLGGHQGYVACQD